MAGTAKHILLVGGNGSLGRFLQGYLRNCGFQVSATSRQLIHIVPGKHSDALQVLAKLPSDLIVNLAGYVREQSIALPPIDVLDLNSLFPQNAARFFARLGKPLVHISTDCVFSGKNGPYSESAICDAEEIYGLSKAGADNAACMVLRGSYLGPGLPPTAYGLFEWICNQRQKKISGFTNTYWNGITYLTLAKIIAAIANEELYEPGVFHIPSAVPMSRFELIHCMNDIFDLQIQLTPEVATQPVSRILQTEKTKFQEYLAEPIEDQIFQLRAFLAATQALRESPAEVQTVPSSV